MNLPSRIGKYELLEFLGGGMSNVYRGHDSMIDRPVVVKILTVTSSSDPEAKARFLQEARLAGNIQHENIVSVFDYGEHDGLPYIVMEYLRGEDLRHAIREQHIQGLDRRIDIALAMAKALEHAHSRGIVHRDIKPENIHIDVNGKVKLMDFGIAKSGDMHLTKTGMAMGTPYYMAPEQVMGKPATPLIDIYAFGLVVYEILTGMRSISGETMETVFYQILHVPVDEEAMTNAGVPPALQDLVKRCSAKKAEDRPQNFGQVCDELRAMQLTPDGNPQHQGSLLDGKTRSLLQQPVAPLLTMPEPIPAAPRSTPPVVPPRNGISAGTWIAMAAIVLAGVGGAGAWWWTHRAVPQIPGMVYIPAGRVHWQLDRTTVEDFELKAYYIDEAEVSNADFADFCRVTGCTAPSAAADLPVVDVTIAQARAYAAWRGKRLPNAREWERAARGPNGLLFPWGNQIDPSKANVVKDNSMPSTRYALMPVRSFAGYPAFNMVGNAWELVDGTVTPSQQSVDIFSTLMKPPPTAQEPWVSMRGGSFNTPLTPGLTYDSSFIPARFAAPDIGFRCVKDP